MNKLKFVTFYTLLYFSFTLTIGTLNQEALAVQFQNTKNLDLPNVPRATAYETYMKFKAGKAIIIHAGGQPYEKRHILGSINLLDKWVRNDKISLPKLPKHGVEIFIYCY